MTEQSERVSAAVATVAATFTAIGTIRAPAGMTRIRKISIGIAPDMTIASTSIRIAAIVRIIGSGILEQSPHDYIAASGGIFGLTDGGFASGLLNQDYDVDIPIGLGGDITISESFIGEVLTAGTITVGLIFDNLPSVKKNNMADVISAVQPTAADAWQTIGTLVVPQGEAGKAPSKIDQIIIGYGLDQGIAAFSLRHALNIRLTGSGLKGGGLHEFVAAHGDTGLVVIGGSILQNITKVHDTNLEVNPAGQILVEAILINEIATAGSVLVGVVYE